MMEHDDHKYKILIVDDEPSDIQRIAKILGKNEYAISYAGDGGTALEMTNRNNFDLILLDIIMPGRDGFDICFEIKKNQNTKDIPIIFLTAKSDISDIVKGFRIGGVDYVTKPFNELELSERIRTHLELKSKWDALKTELRLKETIMTDNALYITKRNELSKSIIHDLKELDNKTHNHYSNAINAINRKLNSLIEGQEWKEFEVRINEVHKDFQKKLFKKFPDLTPNDMKLCTFLRLNMATREIAEITNQSVGALETARSRLRKKLNLPHSANLVNFLHQF